MKRTKVYALDLTQVDGNGEISCPRCGNVISPEDETEEAYSILEPKINSQGLCEVEIRCNKCSSIIFLTGFSILHKLSTLGCKTSHEVDTEVYVAHV